MAAAGHSSNFSLRVLPDLFRQLRGCAMVHALEAAQDGPAARDNTDIPPEREVQLLDVCFLCDAVYALLLLAALLGLRLELYRQD